MKFFVKLKDMKPGQVSVTERLDSPGAEAVVWKAMRPFVKIPQKAWGITIELNVTVECVVPDPDSNEGLTAYENPPQSKEIG